MGDTKMYPVPKELAEMFDEATANGKCRDVCVGSWFRAKRAIKYAKQQIQIERDFWKQLREVYPEFGEKTLRYNSDTGMVWVKED